MFSPQLIERLFSKFALMWGNQFAAMWENIPPEDVKRCWSDELSVFTIEQVGIAVDKLKSEGGKFPPSLPDFLRMCQWARSVRPDAAISEFPVLPARLAEGKQSAEYIAAKARCMAEVAKFGKTPPSRDWAYRIIDRAQEGKVVLPAVLAKAHAAVSA